MSKIKVGDRVRIKDRPDWPTPPGYRLAKSEGEVTSVNVEDGFVSLRLVKTKTDLPKLQPKDFAFTFRLDDVEKI